MAPTAAVSSASPFVTASQLDLESVTVAASETSRCLAALRNEAFDAERAKALSTIVRMLDNIVKRPGKTVPATCVIHCWWFDSNAALRLRCS